MTCKIFLVTILSFCYNYYTIWKAPAAPAFAPARTYAPRDAESAAPVAPKRTERVDDFADFSFGKIEL